MKKTLAIFSLNKITYSETFIQAHKNLDFNIKYYYGGELPTALEGEHDILKLSFKERIKRRLLKDFTFAEKKIIFSLRKEKVDCILAEYGVTACATLDIVRFLQIPMVVHFHGFDAHHKPTIEKYKDDYRKVFNYVSAIIAVSKKMKVELIKLGCPDSKIIVSSCGPNPDFFKNTPKFNNRQFITVGRFVEKKSPYSTILAFKQIVDKYPDARLVMVGEGELHSSCKVLVRTLNLEGNVEFKGVQTHKKVKELFEESLALLQPSIVANDGDSEGTPVAVLEAQAAGLPVIGTYHAGIPDVVIHNETGLLVREHDIDTMAHNMLLILKETGLAKSLGDRGRKRVMENFTMEKHLDTLNSLIKEACCQSN
jgi:glycosyltransferase involved in cell wall biosynthesis